MNVQPVMKIVMNVSAGMKVMMNVQPVMKVVMMNELNIFFNMYTHVEK